jgi:hypothetical protein
MSYGEYYLFMLGRKSLSVIHVASGRNYHIRFSGKCCNNHSYVRNHYKTYGTLPTGYKFYNSYHTLPNSSGSLGSRLSPFDAFLLYGSVIVFWAVAFWGENYGIVWADLGAEWWLLYMLSWSVYLHKYMVAVDSGLNLYYV